jgi:2-polyprenyl-6-methoxyphenol hydroxylase-like FAD-dependent oxidoreductase
MLDFLIVGGGIGGTVLAHLLARQGKRVEVLERERAPRHVVRPEVFWPTTVASISPLLSHVPAESWQVPIQELRAFPGGGRSYSVGHEFFEQLGFHPCSTDPNVTRSALVDGSGLAIRRGVEVTELLRDGPRVVGVRARDTATGQTEEITARWIIGDDGPRSRVREACGIAIDVRPMNLLLACCEFAWPAELPAATVHIVVNPQRSRSGVVVCGAIPLPAGRGIALVIMRPRLQDDPAAAADGLAHFARSDPIIGRILAGRRYPEEFTRIQPHFGHAAAYGAPGVVLLGDAAHPVTPAGGQGANMAVADAVALAACAAEGDERLVERFDRRRRAANERSVAISRQVARGWRLPSWLFNALLPWGIRHLASRPERLARLLRRFATAHVADEDAGAPRPAADERR